VKSGRTPGVNPPRDNRTVQDAPDAPQSRRAEIGYRVGGTLVGVGFGAMSGFWAALLTPLYVVIGGAVIRLPVAALVVFVANVAIFLFTRYVTGSTALALIPAVSWLIVIGAAGRTKSEGDLLITGSNWVGIVTILVGALAWAAGPYVSVIRGTRKSRSGAALPSSRPTLPGRDRRR
jgi:hypothetical protein